MGKRGPAPTPTALKILEHRQPCRINGREPKPEPGTPVCPRDATPEARRLWPRVTRLLPEGVLTKADKWALLGLCSALARAIQADRVLSEKGLTRRTLAGDVVQRPEVNISTNSWKAARGWFQEFGMTPASRSRIVLALEGEPVDEFESLYGN